MLTISLHTMLFGAFAIFAAPDVQPTNVDELQLADEVQEDAMQPADEFPLADEFQDAEEIDEEELEYTDGDERAGRWVCHGAVPKRARCLATCTGQSRRHPVFTSDQSTNKKQWERCKDQAQRFCKNHGRELKRVCWGYRTLTAPGG